MTVEFDVTRDDLLAYVHEVQAEQRIVRRNYLRGFAWGPILGVMLVAVVRAFDLLHAAILIIGCTGLYAGVWFCVWPIYLARVARILVDDGLMRKENGHHTIDLQEEGILETAEWGYAFRKWAVVERVVKAPFHIFLVVVGQGPIVVVPRRAFSTPLEEAAFVQLVTSRVGAVGAAQQGDEPVEAPS